MSSIHFMLICLILNSVPGSTVYKESSAGCPASQFPLTTYGDTCLQFNFNHTYWGEARNSCLSDGGDLIQIRTRGLQQFLEHYLASQSGEKTGFWIGASDKDNESQWEWISGDKTMGYSNWQDGQGTRAGSHIPDLDLDDCALMRVDYGFKWYDVPCKNKFFKYSYICQYDMDLFYTSFFIFLNHFVHSSPIDNCPPHVSKSDLYTYGDSCLKVHYGNYDWDDARHKCRQEGGDLVEIRESGMQHFLQRVLSHQRSEEDGFWIGATDRDSESHWKWVSSDSNMSYSNWEHGQGPSQSGFFLASGSLEDCALMRVDSGFRWHDYDCSSIFYHYSFICQYDTVHQTTTYETVGAIIG
ncbi:C-type mannose receptor 2-like [Saccostrea echinata]|uniref:C-type mannose receptor 2-like n=1 Tax=Saccostrea echinata TaxID=191078 RepID=UPI002A7EDF35|nr:C-type mannose receptor 2-like [Saccostrea echinata]